MTEKLEYEFNTKEDFEALFNSLFPNQEAIDEAIYLQKRLGFLELEKAVLDAQGNEITPAVYSDKYAVDFVWWNEQPIEFAVYRVTPNNPKHVIA